MNLQGSDSRRIIIIITATKAIPQIFLRGTRISLPVFSFVQRLDIHDSINYNTYVAYSDIMTTKIKRKIDSEINLKTTYHLLALSLSVRNLVPNKIQLH